MTHAPTHPDPRRRTTFPWRPVLVVLLVPVVPVVVLVAALHSPWGMKTVANLAMRAVPLWPETRLEATAARGGFGSGIELYGIRLIAPNGPLAGVIDTLRVSYQLHELLGSPRRVREIRIAGLQLLASRLPRAVAKDRKSRAERRPPQVTLDRLELHRTDLEIHVPSFGRDSVLLVKGLDLTMTDFRLHESTSLALDTLSATLVAPAAPTATLRFAMAAQVAPDRITLRSLALDGKRTRVAGMGTVVFPTADGAGFAGTDVRLSFRPLAGSDIARFMPPFADPGDVTLEFYAHTQDSSLLATLDARAQRGGHVTLDAQLPAMPGRPVVLRTDGSIRRLDLGAVLGGAPDSLVVEAKWDIDVSGPDRGHLSGPFAMNFDHTRSGDIELEVAQLTGRFDDSRATFDAEGMAAGFSFKGSGVVSPLEHLPAYNLAGTLSVPSLPLGVEGGDRQVEASANRRGQAPPPVLFAGDVRFRVQGRGTRPDSATATAEVDIAPDPSHSPLIGRGRAEASLAAGIARWRLDLDAASGTVHADGDAKLQPVLAYRLSNGDVTGVNVAAFAGDTTHSRLSARFRAEGRGTHPDSIQAKAEITSLDLAYGVHRAEDGAVTLRLERGRGRLDASARIDRAKVEAHASVTPVARPREAHLEIAFRDLDLAAVLGDSTFASRLAGGVDAQLRGPDLAALFTTPREYAAVDAARGSVLLALEPSTLRDQKVSALELRGDLEHGVVDLRGRLASSFGGGRLAGVARPFDETPSLRLDPVVVEALDLAAVLGIRGQRLEVQGTFKGAVAGLDAGSLEGDAELILDGSRLNGVTFDHLAARGRLTGGRLDARLTAHAGSDTADIVVEGRPFAAPAPFAARGAIHFQELAAALGIDSLRAGVGLAFDIEGDLPRSRRLRDLRLSGHIEGGGSSGDARLDSLNATFDVKDGVAQLQRFAVRGNVVSGNAAGRIALPRAGADSTAFQLEGTLGSLESLAPLLGLRDLASLGGTYRVSVSGPVGATKFAGNVAIRRPHMNEIWADSLTVDFAGTIRESTVTLDARIGARALVVWPMRTRDLDATVNWDGRELVVDTRSTLEGRRVQILAGRVGPVAHGWRGRVDRIELRHGDESITLQKPAVFEAAERLTLDDFVLLEDGVPRLRAHGGREKSGDLAFVVHVDSLNIAEYLDPLGLPGLRGRLSLDGTITGRRERPVVEVTMRARLIAGERKPALVTGRLLWADSLFDLTTAFDQSAGHRIAVALQLPLVLSLAVQKGTSAVTLVEGTMSGSLDAERFDFSWFEPLISPRVARQPRGWLSGSVRAEGDPQMPSYSGSLAFTDGRVVLPRLGVTYQNGEALLSFSDRTITVERARLESDGSLEVTGTGTFRGPGRRTVDLRATLRRFVPMNTLGTKAMLSGDLSFSGQLRAPVARGKLTLLNSTVYAEAGTATSVEAVELSPRDRLDLQERFGVGVGATSGTTMTLLDSADVAVEVAIGDNVWVRRRSEPIVALELQGDVRAIRSLGQPPEAHGTLGVRTGRSYMSFLGRRFDITRAQVELPGPLDSARVQLSAFYSSQAGGSSSTNVDVTATVTIDASGVETDLKSEPYMDHASLLNYLATGQIQGGMQSGTGYGLAVGSALGAVGGAAGRSLGLDVVQVTMDAYGGQTLSAGSYVDPRLYLGFRQSVVEAQTTGTSSSPGSTPTEFEIEVEARKNLLLNLQGSSSQYRFLIKPRLGR